MVSITLGVAWATAASQAASICIPIAAIRKKRSRCKYTTLGNLVQRPSRAVSTLTWVELFSKICRGGGQTGGYDMGA